jgi:hypothetical protein
VRAGVDGKVVVEESTIEKIEESGGCVTIRDLKLGAIVADLSFKDYESVLEGTRPSATDPTHMEPVKLVYKRFQPAAYLSTS